MEQTESEDDFEVCILLEKLKVFLKDTRYNVAFKVEKKCEKYINIIDKINDTFSSHNEIESVLLSLLHLLNTLNKNIDDLHTGFKDLVYKFGKSEKHKTLFKQLYSELNFAKNEVETDKVDRLDQAIVSNSVHNVTENNEITDIKNNKIEDEKSNFVENTIVNIYKSKLSLNKKYEKSDEDTDDSWKDILGRNMCPTNKNSAKELTETKENEDEWEKETINLNLSDVCSTGSTSPKDNNELRSSPTCFDALNETDAETNEVDKKTSLPEQPETFKEENTDSNVSSVINSSEEPTNTVERSSPTKNSSELESNGNQVGKLGKEQEEDIVNKNVSPCTITIESKKAEKQLGKEQEEDIVDKNVSPGTMTTKSKEAENQLSKEQEEDIVNKNVSACTMAIESKEAEKQTVSLCGSHDINSLSPALSEASDDAPSEESIVIGTLGIRPVTVKPIEEKSESGNSDDTIIINPEIHKMYDSVLENNDKCLEDLKKNNKNKEDHDSSLSEIQENFDMPLSKPIDEIKNETHKQPNEILSQNKEEEKNSLDDRENVLDLTTEDFNSDITSNLPTEQINLDEEVPNCSNNLGEDLLKLLREVPCLNTEYDGRMEEEEDTDSDSDNELSEEAQKIFKMYQEESDISSSAESDLDVTSLSLSDLSDKEFWPNNNKMSDTNEKPKKEDLEANSKKIKKNKELYVSLKRLDLNKLDISITTPSYSKKKSDNSMDSIDRLCNLNNLLNNNKKRNNSNSDSSSSEKSLRKQRKKKCPTSRRVIDSSSSSDCISDSFSENDTVPNEKTDISFLSKQVEDKLDETLANEVYNMLPGNSSNSDHSDDESSDTDIDKDLKKKRKRSGDDGTITTYKKVDITEEEAEKKRWKNDPLLRGRLTSDSDCSSNDSTPRRRRIREKRLSVGNKTNIKNKRDIPSFSQKEVYSITSSEDDSDVQELTTIDPILSSPAQKGRRNIRALLSDESLAKATQAANQEENERIERLEQKNQIKIKKSQSLSQNSTSREPEEDSLVLDMDEATNMPIVTVHQMLSKKLKPHQKEGVQFMWDACYENINRIKTHQGSGCILAHCMGLGKTFQVLTLIHTLFAHKETNTKHVLVVCPLSTVNNWKKEVEILHSNLKEDQLKVFSISNRKEVSKKYSVVRSWHVRKRSILIMGYDAFEGLTNEAKLEKCRQKNMLEFLVDPGPDLIICDEGHLLRNKNTLKTQALNRIKTRRRIVLTGTPLQNNLLEYYHMVNFVKPNLLGNLKEFKTNFVNPITNGQYEDSTLEDIKLMKKRTHVLHKILAKSIQRYEDSELKLYLPKMLDHAIFVQLQTVQVELYKKFSNIVKNKALEATSTRNRLFSNFATFRYIGTHPYLLDMIEKTKNKQIKEKDVVIMEDNAEERDEILYNNGEWWKSLVPENASEDISCGSKLVVLKAIVEECEEIGDKVLVFSQSLCELDLIEHFFQKVGTSKCFSWTKNVDYIRMDGTVMPEQRQHICDNFNDRNDKSLRMLLMSTKVGGLGLNLTAANRVVIMTVNWNPSYDTQSVFRAYRFGQDKQVYVYRLISLGTMEEKVYHRTVTKLAIAHRVVDKHQITRHYKSVDLQELYECQPESNEQRPTQKIPEDKLLAKIILKIPCIFKYHEHQTLLANRPEDKLDEQELNAAWDEFKNAAVAPRPKPVTIPLYPDIFPEGPSFATAYSLLKDAPGTSNNPIIKTIENIVKILTTGNTKEKNNEPRNEGDTEKVSVSTSLTIASINNNDLNTEKDPLFISNTENNSTRSLIKNSKVEARLAKTKNRDPLFIPQMANQSAKTYIDIFESVIEKEQVNLAPRTENGITVTQVLPSTSIVIEDDDETANNAGCNEKSQSKTGQDTNATNLLKRNHNEILCDSANLIENMKKKFKEMRTDTKSETDATSTNNFTAVSNGLLNNLKLSGVSVHMIPNVSSNDDIIMLD